MSYDLGPASLIHRLSGSKQTNCLERSVLLSKNISLILPTCKMLLPGLVPSKNSTDVYRDNPKAIIEIKIFNTFI